MGGNIGDKCGMFSSIGNNSVGRGRLDEYLLCRPGRFLRCYPALPADPEWRAWFNSKQTRSGGCRTTDQRILVLIAARRTFDEFS
jgi:hypothetical protein